MLNRKLASVRKLYGFIQVRYTLHLLIIKVSDCISGLLFFLHLMCYSYYSCCS